MGVSSSSPPRPSADRAAPGVLQAAGQVLGCRTSPVSPLLGTPPPRHRGRGQGASYRSCSPVSRTSAMCSSSAAFCCMLLMPSSIAAGLRAQHPGFSAGSPQPPAPCPHLQGTGRSPSRLAPPPAVPTHTHTHPARPAFRVIVSRAGRENAKAAASPPGCHTAGEPRLRPHGKGDGPGGLPAHSRGAPEPGLASQGAMQPPRISPMWVADRTPPPSCSPHLFVPRAAEGEKP